MKNTIKALSKQLFGAKYESARKSLLAAAILFIAIYAAEIRVAVAPAILFQRRRGRYAERRFVPFLDPRGFTANALLLSINKQQRCF